MFCFIGGKNWFSYQINRIKPKNVLVDTVIPHELIYTSFGMLNPAAMYFSKNRW